MKIVLLCLSCCYTYYDFSAIYDNSGTPFITVFAFVASAKKLSLFVVNSSRYNLMSNVYNSVDDCGDENFSATKWTTML